MSQGYIHQVTEQNRTEQNIYFINSDRMMVHTTNEYTNTYKYSTSTFRGTWLRKAGGAAVRGTSLFGMSNVQLDSSW